MNICPQCETGHTDNAVTCNNPESTYMNGAGVKEDKEKARQVLLRVCALGSNEACEWRKQLYMRAAA
jgi:TPR repeat protein